MIPTAEKFIISNEVKQGFLFSNSEEELENIIESHIEFAKLHVEAALKAAMDKSTLIVDGELEDSSEYRMMDENNYYTPTEIIISKDSILNAYPLDNIK